MWACPHCSEALQLNATGDAWACVNKHQFDCAKEGYVNLLPANRKRSVHPGDSPEMIAARRRVHSGNLYQPLADAIEGILSPLEEINRMLDLGCGGGYVGPGPAACPAPGPTLRCRHRQGRGAHGVEAA